MGCASVGIWLLDKAKVQFTIIYCIEPFPPIYLREQGSEQGSSNIQVTFGWYYLQNTSIVDYYLLSINPSAASGVNMTATSNSMINLTLKYNTNYLLTVVAVNCVGKSLPLYKVFNFGKCCIQIIDQLLVFCAIFYLQLTVAILYPLKMAWYKTMFSLQKMPLLGFNAKVAIFQMR